MQHGSGLSLHKRRTTALENAASQHRHQANGGYGPPLNVMLTAAFEHAAHHLVMCNWRIAAYDFYPDRHHQG